MVLHRGLENVVAQGLWGKETACQVGLSGVYDLDKWRGAGISNREVGKLPVGSASGGCHVTQLASANLPIGGGRDFEGGL